jgi:hypothetical protein
MGLFATPDARQMKCLIGRHAISPTSQAMMHDGTASPYDWRTWCITPGCDVIAISLRTAASAI